MLQSSIHIFAMDDLHKIITNACTKALEATSNNKGIAFVNMQERPVKMAKTEETYNQAQPPPATHVLVHYTQFEEIMREIADLKERVSRLEQDQEIRSRTTSHTPDENMSVDHADEVKFTGFNEPNILNALAMQFGGDQTITGFGRKPNKERKSFKALAPTIRALEKDIEDGNYMFDKSVASMSFEQHWIPLPEDNDIFRPCHTFMALELALKKHATRKRGAITFCKIKNAICDAIIRCVCPPKKYFVVRPKNNDKISSDEDDRNLMVFPKTMIEGAAQRIADIVRHVEDREYKIERNSLEYSIRLQLVESLRKLRQGSESDHRRMYAYTDGEYADAVSEFAATSGLIRDKNNENSEDRPHAPIPIMTSLFASECTS